MDPGGQRAHARRADGYFPLVTLDNPPQTTLASGVGPHTCAIATRHDRVRCNLGGDLCHYCAVPIYHDGVDVRNFDADEFSGTTPGPEDMR